MMDALLLVLGLGADAHAFLAKVRARPHHAPGRENRTKEAAMTIPNRAAPLMAKMLAECGDGEWRTINAIAERAGLSAESAWGVIKNIRRRRQAMVEHQRGDLSQTFWCRGLWGLGSDEQIFGADEQVPDGAKRLKKR
jgi:hypothetical protein